MSSSLEKQVFQPNFVKFTNTEIVDRNPISGTTFFGNQNNGFQLVKFADGSNGVEKRLKHWVGNKTGRLYRGELLGAQEYLAARVGEVMNAPIRDCHFTSKDAQIIVMPFIDGRSGAEMNDKDIPDTPQGVALRLFDYLVANADRRPKNIMFADNGNIVGIDHALCNFRPREPKPELITILWNGGVTLSSLEILKPKLLALGGLFSQMGMTEKFGNLIGNLDRLIAAFTKIQNIAVAKAAFDSQTPPQAVQQAAKQALEWIADGKAGRNFTSVGRKRASDLAHGHPVSLETLKRMKAYFDRHGVDKQTPHWNEPSPGKVAWYAWGGDAGYSWAKKMVARAEKAAEAVRKDADTDRKKADAKLKEAEALAAEAFDFRRREHFESAANAHANASRLFFEASKLYGNDENGDAVSALARGNSEKDLAESARFTDQMGEQHSPAEIHDGTWVDGGAWAGGTDPVEKGDVVGHEFHGNQWTGDEYDFNKDSYDHNAWGSPLKYDSWTGATTEDKSEKVGDYVFNSRLPSSEYIAYMKSHFSYNNIPTPDKLTTNWKDEMAKARSKYVVSDVWATKINDKLRKDKALSPKQQTEFEAVKKWAESETIIKPVSLYRVSILPDAVLDKLQPGTSYLEKGFQSTSISPSDMINYGVSRRLGGDTHTAISGNRVYFRLNAPKGTKAVDAYSEEVVLPPNTQVSVTSRATDKMGNTYITADINNSTEVKKGDSPGHEFHGNQYEAGIVSKLDAGESPEIASADLPGLVSGIHDLGSRGHGYDITNLKVDGEKPFQTDHDADLLREHMPQILPSQRAEFLKDIQSEYGIVSKAEEVNPKTLKPSQTEIDGWKTGGVYKEFAEKGIPAERAPLVSSDNYIIDGHHYWSAAIALKAANPDYKLPIRRLSCDLDTALKVANQWHDKVGNPRLSLGDTQVSKSGVAGQSGDKEGHAFRGNQWWMMGPDGVPVPRPRAPKTDTGDKTPAAPKAPRVSTPRAPKATPTAETPKPIYQEDLKVPYGKGVIPPGWKKTGTTSVVIPSRDWSKPPKIVNCTTFSSAKGNTAIIGTRARGWKIGDRYTNTVLMTIDRFATGKQVEFVHTLRQGANTLASVSLGNPNSLMIGRYGIIGRDLKAGIEKYRPNYQTDDTTPEAIKAQADWDSLKDTAVAQAKGEINTQEGRDALDKVEATLQATDNSNLAKGFTIDKLGRTWNTGDLFMSSQRRIESTIIHELGHSNFFSDGKKITDVIPELQKSLGSKVDLSKENESGKRGFVRNIKTPALNFGGKTIVPRGEVKDFLDKHEPGIYPLSLDTTKALKAIGGTKYGTSSLQELGAESFAQFQLGITQSPITQAFATSLGWQQAGTTVAKSGSVADMSQSQSPNVYYSPEFGGEVARVFLEDSLDGPRLVVGDSVENYGHPDQTDDSTEDEE